MKRAAIYVRTSSEQQGEKASPDEQERDCRQAADERGLEVVAVFRDVQKYRAGRKMVEPSGTRSDRPGLVAMMEAGGRGEFDTIIAWKEDRLYRGLKALVYVLEGLQEHRLEVALARETFDPRMAPVKAWLAGMELENLKERMAMGVKARLRGGMANTGQDRYGYERVGGDIVVVEEEARWVKQMFEWYCDGVSLAEIRRRLIEAGVKQKGGSVARKMPWGRSVIQSVLQAGEAYALGVKRMSRGGEWYELPVEPIISMALWEKAQAVRQANKTRPSGRPVKHDYLCKGLIRCSCGRTWGVRMSSWRAKGVKRKTPVGGYYCPQVVHKEQRHPDCPKWMGSRKVDETVWAMVVEVLRAPEALLAAAREYVAGLQGNAGTMGDERERLERELEQTAGERSWVITQARKGRITEDEMDEQLAAVGEQELYLRREIARLGAAIDLAGLAGWEDVATAYLADLADGLAGLEEEEPAGEEARRQRFEARRQIVKGLVERVEIAKSRKLTVVFRLDVLALLEGGEGGIFSPGWGGWKVGDGICSRK